MNKDMNKQQRDQMLDSSTKFTSVILSTLSTNLTSSSPSSPAPVRARTMVSTIYIAGIAFMVGVFLVLLWVNLFSRHCWCWHDTSVGNRFNRQWLIQRSIAGPNDSLSSKDRYQRRASNEEELQTKNRCKSVNTDT